MNWINQERNEFWAERKRKLNNNGNNNIDNKAQFQLFVLSAKRGNKKNIELKISRLLYVFNKFSLMNSYHQ